MNNFNTKSLKDKRNIKKIKSVSPFRILNGVSITNPDTISGDERKIIERTATKERDRIKASGEKIPKSLDTQKVLEAMRKEALDLQRDSFKKLNKIPGISETIDWAESLMALGHRKLNQQALDQTLGVILKSSEDI